MQLNNLLRFDYWLDTAVVNEPAGRGMWAVVAAGLVLVFVTGVFTLRGHVSRSTGIALGAAGMLFAGVGIGRIFAIPVLGLRLGWLIAGVLALGPVIMRIAVTARRDGFADDCIRALAFAPPRERQIDWHAPTTLAWLIFHCVGLVIILTNVRLPAIWGVLWLLVLLAPLLISMWLRRAHGQSLERWRLSALSPLVILYGIALMGAFGVRIEGILNGVLSLPLALIIFSAYAFVIAARFSLISRQSSNVNEDLFVRIGVLILVAATVAWAIWAALTLRTHGVTGSDPYAYAQMGVDLATRGTVFHPFPLIEQTYALNIGSYPVTHIGYRIPTDVSRESTTVWPPGYAVFTALAYLIGGESGLYLITPFFNLLALGVVGWMALLVNRVSPLSPLGRGHAIAALTIFLTATSYQQIEWQMIPMADIAAQVFTLLAIGLALHKPRATLHNILCGLALGTAFGIRYTQVLACIPIALAFLMQDDLNASFVPRLKSIIVCALAAFIAALPVLIYHQLAFGSALVTGSEELGNFSLTQMPQTVLRTLGELNSHREFGLLTPFMGAGAIALWRSNWRALIVLLTLVVVLGGFHVIYAYLRLRDILFLFPVFNLLAAIGVVALFQVASGTQPMTDRQSPIANRLLSITLICAVSYVFVLRSMETLAMPATRGFGAFGYLVREQRASFDHLREMTPKSAVIGCTLNSGAVDLYAQRLTFRPATWQPDELMQFVDTLMREGRPIYILDDGDEIRASITALRAGFTLREVGRIDVPYYDAIGGGSQNRSVPVYQVSRVK